MQGGDEVLLQFLRTVQGGILEIEQPSEFLLHRSDLHQRNPFTHLHELELPLHLCKILHILTAAPSQIPGIRTPIQRRNPLIILIQLLLLVLDLHLILIHNERIVHVILLNEVDDLPEVTADKRELFIDF